VLHPLEVAPAIFEVLDLVEVLAGSIYPIAPAPFDEALHLGLIDRIDSVTSKEGNKIALDHVRIGLTAIVLLQAKLDLVLDVLDVGLRYPLEGLGRGEATIFHAKLMAEVLLLGALLGFGQVAGFELHADLALALDREPHPVVGAVLAAVELEGGKEMLVHADRPAAVWCFQSVLGPCCLRRKLLASPLGQQAKILAC
jgi:hypothetical protein